MTELCRSIVRDAAEGKTDAVDGLIARLSEHCDAIEIALRPFLVAA